MTAPIDFYFDFSSAYGYLMSERIDALAARHGRMVRWRPFLLGAVYKQFDLKPLPSLALKGPYSLHDIERSARFLGIPYRTPDPFPLPTQHAARAWYWFEDGDSGRSRDFAHAVFHAYFRDGRDISQLDTVLDLAAALGAERAALAAALAGDMLKARVRDESAAAIARGVFGSPFVFIDGEPFWGVDRLPQIERWLGEGPF